jgi:hypothetical protein
MSVFTAATPVLNAKYNNIPTHIDPLRKGQTINRQRAASWPAGASDLQSA